MVGSYVAEGVGSHCPYRGAVHKDTRHMIPGAWGNAVCLAGPCVDRCNACRSERPVCACRRCYGVAVNCKGGRDRMIGSYVAEGVGSHCPDR